MSSLHICSRHSGQYETIQQKTDHPSREGAGAVCLTGISINEGLQEDSEIQANLWLSCIIWGCSGSQEDMGSKHHCAEGQDSLHSALGCSLGYWGNPMGDPRTAQICHHIYWHLLRQQNSIPSHPEQDTYLHNSYSSSQPKNWNDLWCVPVYLQVILPMQLPDQDNHGRWWVWSPQGVTAWSTRSSASKPF